MRAGAPDAPRRQPLAGQHPARGRPTARQARSYRAFGARLSSEAEASALIVSGFVEPITKDLPLKYAVEMNRLIQLQMEGSVG